MKHFDKILCPYDFSPHSEEALRYAMKLADNTTGITLLNAIQLPYLIDPNGFSYYDFKADELKKSTEDSLAKKVAEVKSAYPDLNFDFKIEVDNDPAEIVLKVQKEGKYDLIVIGSHGRKGLGRILMGSVAEAILRDADCPVLIIKMIKPKTAA